MEVLNAKLELTDEEKRVLRRQLITELQKRQLEIAEVHFPKVLFCDDNAAYQWHAGGGESQIADSPFVLHMRVKSRGGIGGATTPLQWRNFDARFALELPWRVPYWQ
ncbi:hypothetical protein FOL46_007295 [Perkinsus olseni]|nr:hypothetical protein FOL46_007295 [Perkinsus olseni]